MQIVQNYHFRVVPSEGWGQADIDRFLSEEYNKDKDPDRPLWIFYVLNGLADGRG